MIGKRVLSPRSRVRLGVALLAALTVAGGCGSTRSERELAESQGSTGAPQAAAPAVAGDAPVTTVPPEAGAVAAPDAGSATPVAPDATSGGRATPGGAAVRAGSNGAASSAPTTAPRQNAAASGGPSPSGRGSAAAPAPAPAPGGTNAPPAAAAGSGPKSEVVLGVLATMTGIVGEAVVPTVHAARAWAADVNARGGLGGRPVRLVTGDDGGDPARASSVARRMVDQDKVAAFFAQGMPLTVQAVLPFLEERKIPMIGGCNCSHLATPSPMNFEVGAGSDLGITVAQVAPLLAFSTERKISLFYCREAAICDRVRRVIKEKLAGPFGLQVVHESQTSLAQPDFTAEVLAARNAGAKAVLVLMDNASVIRVKRSAQRQDWEPLISVQWSALDDRFLRDGGKEVDGVLVGSPLPTWDSPRMTGYKTAMARYVPGGVKAGVGLPAWGAGKLLERIAPGLPADRPVTSADILRGLYGVQNETLGGLVPAVSFAEGKPTPESLCSIPTKVVGGRFVPKDGDNYFCPLQSRP